MATGAEVSDAFSIGFGLGGPFSSQDVTFSPASFGINPAGIAGSIGGLFGLPNFGGSPISYQSAQANFPGGSLSISDGFGSGGNFGFAPNLDNPTTAGQGGGGVAILDDGTMAPSTGGIAYGGPSAGMLYVPGKGLFPNPDQATNPLPVNRLQGNLSFSPQNPNAPIDFGGQTLAPLSVQTPIGTVSRDAQGNFSFGSEVGQLRSQQAAAFAAAADGLEEQAAQFDTAPLTQARMRQFDNAVNDLTLRQEQATGNLREQLARRKVLGSSFANSELNRTTTEFERQRKELVDQRAEVEAQSILQEFGVKTDLLTRANALRVQSAQEEIASVLGESELAGQISTALAALAQESLNIKLQIAAAEAQSIRDNLTRQKAIESSATSAQAIAASDREQRQGIGIGNLIGTIFSAPTQSIGGSILGRIFR